jgi:hypothetical protein
MPRLRSCVSLDTRMRMVDGACWIKPSGPRPASDAVARSAHTRSAMRSEERVESGAWRFRPCRGEERAPCGPCRRRRRAGPWGLRAPHPAPMHSIKIATLYILHTYASRTRANIARYLQKKITRKPHVYTSLVRPTNRSHSSVGRTMSCNGHRWPLQLTRACNYLCTYTIALARLRARAEVCTSIYFRMCIIACAFIADNA